MDETNERKTGTDARRKDTAANARERWFGKRDLPAAVVCQPSEAGSQVINHKTREQAIKDLLHLGVDHFSTRGA